MDSKTNAVPAKEEDTVTTLLQNTEINLSHTESLLIEILQQLTGEPLQRHEFSEPPCLIDQLYRSRELSQYNQKVAADILHVIRGQ